GLVSRFGLPQAVDCLTSLGEYMRRRELIRFLGGAVAVLPLASRAQQTTIPRIGVLQFAGPEHMGPFAQALRDLGYVEGKTIQFETRSAEGNADRLPGLVAELISKQGQYHCGFADAGSRSRKERDARHSHRH